MEGHGSWTHVIFTPTMAHTNYFHANFPPTLFHVRLGEVVKDIEGMDEMANGGATCDTTFTQVLTHDSIDGK